jgi:serine/threonine protein kinase
MDLKKSFIEAINKYVDGKRIREDLYVYITNTFEDALDEVVGSWTGDGVWTGEEIISEGMERKKGDGESSDSEIKSQPQKHPGCKYVFLRGKNSGNPCGAGKKDLCGKHTPKQKCVELPAIKNEERVLTDDAWATIEPATKALKTTHLSNSVITSISGNTWTLGPVIGKGGFGEIYAAYDGDKNDKDYPYAVKIEPHANGPLFVEMNFYIRVAKTEDIESFRIKKKLKSLGMPKHIGSGSHTFDQEKYRFIVMEKYGTDVWDLFIKHNNIFKPAVVLKLAMQTLNVLEFIHSKGYVHTDIKAENMLLKQNDTSQMYLLDFGLCGKYKDKYAPDPNKAHNGTLEYVSRDGHCGVQSRRGDLEILGYNMVHWAGGILPWDGLCASRNAGSKKNLNLIHDCKKKYMKDLPLFFKDSFGPNHKIEDVVNTLTVYFENVIPMSFEEDPKYDELEKIISSCKNYDDQVPLQ